MKLDEYIEEKKYQNDFFEGYHNYTEIVEAEFNNCDFSKVKFQGIDINETKFRYGEFSEQ